MALLHEFVASNRAELIRRCRSKVSERDSPRVTSSELQDGVPGVVPEPGQLIDLAFLRRSHIHGLVRALNAQASTPGPFPV